MGNHRSYFDILVGYTTVPGFVGFVAKRRWRRSPPFKELDEERQLPVPGQKGYQGRSKNDPGGSKGKNGISVWIFPEGTRNRNKDLKELLVFKEGSLKIAEKSGCPVVPVAMVGTAEAFESHFPFIRPSHVTVYYGEPFYIKELEPDQRKHAGAYTREKIVKMLGEIQNENA